MAALFGQKNKKEKKQKTAVKAEVDKRVVPAHPKGDPSSRKQTGSVSAGKSTNTGDFSTLVRMRITEKASLKMEQNAYTFEVARGANKKSIAMAVKEMYNVIPMKVHIVAIPAKKRFTRGKKGIKSGGKKAYVYLKQGDSIEYA
jgi:large subunit ribosomal protein L23